MLNEFWFPFSPEVIELLDDLVDLVVNTKVVVGLQSLDFIGLVGFFTESTEEELVELTLVLSSKTVQSRFESSLSGLLLRYK
jgi:hypothetical protein